MTVLTGWPHHPKGEVFEGYEVDALGEEWCGPVRACAAVSWPALLPVL